MKTILYIVTICALAHSHPKGTNTQRAVMVGGYYGQPAFGPDPRRHLPPMTMTFAAGDTIATNAFVGDEDDEEVAANANEEEPDVETTPQPVGKKSAKRRKPEESEEDDEVGSRWPFQGTRNGQPAYNAFFPIMFGGGGGARGRNGDESGFYPGPATAIANSFSTGKGGVATSHATSYGDPYLSSFLRKNGGSFKNVQH